MSGEKISRKDLFGTSARASVYINRRAVIGTLGSELKSCETTAQNRLKDLL